MTNDEQWRTFNSSFVIRKFVISPLFRFHHRSARVMAAVGANHVRRLLRAAFRAGLKLLGLQGVVGAAHSGAGIGLFALGDSHGGNLSEMLACKGFENPSAYAVRSRSVKAAKIVTGLLILFGNWQLIAGLKIITSSGAFAAPTPMTRCDTFDSGIKEMV
jgi:hypothetical protein